MKQKNAFTLIELLVVISIIALLSSIAVASLNTARSKARFTKVVADMNVIGIAVELYYDANNNWPTDTNEASDRGAPTATPLTSYLATWPTPPCAGWVYDYFYEGGWRKMVQIDLRNASRTYLNSYCIKLGDAPNNFCNTGGAQLITAVTNKSITCQETAPIN